MASSQLKAGAFLNYVIIALNAAIGLLYTPYMLRMLGQSEYGLYSLVASVIGYLTLLDFGFGNAVVRYTAKFRSEGKIKEQYSLFGMFLSLYLLIGLISFVAGLVLYANVDNMFAETMTTEELHKAGIMMLILTFNLGITFPFSIFRSIITAYEDFVFQKVVQIFRLVLNALVMVFLLKLGYKAITMVVVHTVFNVITLLLNCFYCIFKIKIRLFFGRFDFSLLKEIAIYSFWIFLSSIMDKIYWGTGQFVLGAVSGTVAVSVFAIAIQLMNMYMSFSTAISSVFLPKVTRMVVNNASDKEMSSLFIRTGRIQYSVIAFILCGFIVFGRPFIQLWAGTGYGDSYIITVLFFVALVAPLIQNLGITILQARNEMRFRSLLYVAIAIVSLVVQIMLSKKMGAVGCAVAVSAALLLGQGLIMNIYYHKKQRLDIFGFWTSILKMSIAPALVSLTSLFVINHISIDSWGRLLLFIGGFSIVYLSFFWVFSMSKNERLLFSSVIHKVIKRNG